MKEFDIVIGLETHIELNTKTKVFCGCKNEFGGEPNTHCCPVCVGLPGVLPVVNSSAIDKAITIGLATNSTISQEFYFDRKHYFYPDLPKSYQISQSRTPICKNGYVELSSGKKIRIHQIHLEEDTGKLIHAVSGETYIDYNRCGVPLIEIVSEPDMSSTDEAIEYLTYIKDLVKQINVSDCKMEQGQLRCDVNVSLKPKGNSVLGTKVEMKNINSFKAIERAINFEVERQLTLLNSGEKIIPETRRWDDFAGQSYSMRSKEGAKDYRFMPEPDLPLMVISDQKLKFIKDNMPLLPKEMKAKLVLEYGLNDYDATQIAKESAVVNFFIETAKNYKDYKKIANWINSEINKKINLLLMEEVVIPVSPIEFAKLLSHVDKGDISQAGSRQLLNKLWDDQSANLEKLIDELGLRLNSNEEELEKIVDEIIQNNPKAVEDFKAGKNVVAFFVGQVMKATRGQAPAGKVNEIINNRLNSLK